ncbi:unnamed protein product [Prorocentrum cordatum]|uniref:Cyclic nucleotide-binding domain-containing protein n=1 Tax=Prorocentrum cordatum TaxID=2364126 RepID=A0ABN9WD92_9DINO|nr:unnamed protein product [Polarella glacialis]
MLAAQPQATTVAFEAHLHSLTEALDVQVGLVRSALDLHPASALLEFRAVTDGALGKLSVAICDLRSELTVAATAAASGESPEAAAAVGVLAGTAKPGSATVVASIAGCVAGICRERASQHPSPAEAGCHAPRRVPCRRSVRVSTSSSDTRVSQHPSQSVASLIPKQVSRRHISISRRSSGGTDAAMGGRFMQPIPSGEELHFENKSVSSAASDFADGDASMQVFEKPMFSRQSSMDGTALASRLGNGVAQTSPCIQGVLNPDWPVRLAWDLAVICMVMCDSVVIPFQLAEFRTAPGFDGFWLWFTVILFSCDVVLNFFTSYRAGKRDKGWQEGSLVTDRISIAINYLRGWFWIDFLSTVPWTVIAKAVSSNSEGSSSSAGQVTKLAKVVKLTRLLRLMRMLRLCKLSIIWDRIESRIGSITALNVVSMLKVLGTWAAICHWGACIWWMVGKRDSLVMLLTMQDGAAGMLHWTELPRMHSPHDEEIGLWTWVERPASEQYVFCFYWILGVMRTMPAEVTPINLTERVFVLVFMFFAVAAFAVNVTRITQAWFRFGSRRDAFKEEMACVRMHLRTINCGETLQKRTQAYLNHLFEKRKIHAKELGLLSALPEGLKKKLSHAQKIHFLRMLPPLKDWVDPALRYVCDATEALDYLPGDKLTEKDNDAVAAYVLMRGGLQVYDPSDKRPGGRISQFSVMSAMSNWSIGPLTVVDEHCLFERGEAVRSKDTVMVLECSEVLRVDRQRFQEALEELRAPPGPAGQEPPADDRRSSCTPRLDSHAEPPLPRYASDGSQSQTEETASRAEEETPPIRRLPSRMSVRPGGEDGNVSVGESGAHLENNSRVLRLGRMGAGAMGQGAFHHTAAASLAAG